MLTFSCQQGKKETTIDSQSPQVIGALSKDPAIMTTQVLTAMGGAKNWEELKFVSWTFFGSRHLIWDKLNNRVRIDSPRDSSIYVLNMTTGDGRFWKDGNEVLDKTVHQEKMEKAKNIWINDMYWLFMPFKMTDPGVELLYVREDSIDSKQNCSLFSMTFDNVGNTPENKYEICIDHNDHLIKKWSFYEKSSDTVAYATWPWDNYKFYNGLLLSGERSDKKGPSNIKVYDDLEDSVFNSIECFSYY